MNQIAPDFDPNDLESILRHLSEVAGPHYKDAISSYNNATGLDVNGRYQGYNAARYLLPAIYKQLASQVGFRDQYQPLFQSSMAHMLGSLANPDARAASARNAIMANQGSATQNILQRLKSGGLGIGAQQGAQLAVSNQFTDAGNKAAAQPYTPEGMDANHALLMHIMKSLQPNFGDLEALHGITVGTPRNKTGADIFGEMAGNAAGQWAGGRL